MSKPRILCNGWGRTFQRTQKGLPRAHSGTRGSPCRSPTMANQQILHPVDRPGFPSGHRVTLRRCSVYVHLSWCSSRDRWILASIHPAHYHQYTDDLLMWALGQGWQVMS